MRLSPFSPRPSHVAAAVLAVCASSAALAQGGDTPQRLSQAVLAQGHDLSAPLWVHWRVPQQRLQQQQQKATALDLATDTFLPQALTWWANVPVTGRAYLSAQPSSDHRLRPPLPQALGVPMSTRLTWSPYYSQSLGGPDGFVLFQAGLSAEAYHALGTGTWVSAKVNARLLDNFDKFKYTAPSNLPRVRTWAREYVTTSAVTLPNAQITHLRDWGQGQHLSAYAGLLEPMFAGVGAEWLYRPWAAPWAVGVDVNHVRQRAFEQDLGLRDYRVNTGHATLYWDTGWQDVHARLSAGKYLAGDWGMTLDLSRRYRNGVTIGAWATKTNVSAEQFGEGGFDKGIYVKLPFDVLVPSAVGSEATVAWNSLTRDGGAKLNRRYNLYDLTRLRDPSYWGLTSAEYRAPRTGQMPDLQGALPVNRWLSPVTSAQSVYDGLSTTKAAFWWTAAGLSLASSALDSEGARWAQNHAGGRSQKASKVLNTVPAWLALGNAAVVGLDLGGRADVLAQRSLHAGAYALGASLVIKELAGRQRPNGQAGAMSSNHVAVAMALATPWAQHNRMPWLWGLAASTAFARVQNQSHWVSDTVVGGLLGYAMGQWVMTGVDVPSTRSPRWRVNGQEVTANWSFE